MRTEVLECHNCGETAQHIHMGMMPLEFLTPDNNIGWFRAIYCTSCETLNPKGTTQEDLEWAEERFLHGLVEHGLMEEEEAKNILGIN